MKAWMWVLVLALVAPCAWALDADDRMAIDRALAERNLNPYGDPVGTMYPGGTPLFDESTGAREDRHEYVLRKHPDLRHAMDSEHPHGPFVAPPADRSRPAPEPRPFPDVR